MAVSRSTARRSARASGDQMTAIRFGGASSLIGLGSLAQAEFAEDLGVRDAFAAGEGFAGTV